MAMKRQTSPGYGRRSVMIFIAVSLLAVGAFLALRSPKKSSRTTDVPVRSPLHDFVGAETCAKCHPNEYNAWKTSTHGRAGGEPSTAEIIAPFDGQPLFFKDATVVPTKSPDGGLHFVVQQEGSPPFNISVDAVVGGGHMVGGGTQSFFDKFPDGTLRFLPFDFIRRENLWFVQLRKDQTWAPVTKELSFQSDLANWPPSRVLGTPVDFSNCQNCHGSQIATFYDQKTRRYETHYQTLQINCESCHGPGRRHIEIVSKPNFELLADIGMTPLATLSKDQSLNVCFQCHATKTAIREEPYLPGASLEDYFSLKLPIFTDDPYTVDGRIRSFGYQANHLFSDCYLNGSMTCVDCHDPHSQQYRDVFGRPLVGRFDNRQCTSCHASKGLAPERHSHHKSNSPGNLCTSCHMPYLQHKGVGAHLVFARSDHTIPIPRPAFDQQLGIENACQKCHADKDLAWQEARIQEWYGQIKPHNPVVADQVRGRQILDPAFAKDLLLAPDAKHPIAQAQGLSTYIRRYIRPRSNPNPNPNLNPDLINKLTTFTTSNDLDLKALALMALHIGFDHEPHVRSMITNQLSSLPPPPHPLRLRWAIAAEQFGSALSANNDPQNAILCFIKSLEVMPENIVTLSHLARTALQIGDAEMAIGTMQQAIRLQPSKGSLHFQLGQLYIQLQLLPEAIRAFEEGLKHSPEDRNARIVLEKLRAAPSPP